MSTSDLARHDGIGEGVKIKSNSEVEDEMIGKQDRGNTFLQRVFLAIVLAIVLTRKNKTLVTIISLGFEEICARKSRSNLQVIFPD